MARGFRRKHGPVARASTASDVLELRVHGVNNTTPAALLDLPDDGVTLVAGDKLGSFWQPTKDAAAAATPGSRGYVPPGITREAYSWGGMVRTTPNFGGVGKAGTVAGVAARVLYAMILPFSIGNAVVWSRRLTASGERHPWAGVTAGLARLFGFTLTLIFTMTAVTVSLDMVGTQCAAQQGLCAPIQGLLHPLAPWTPGQRLALFTLGPLLAVAGLWLFSSFSRLRYDVLPGMEDHTAPTRTLAPTRKKPTALPTAVLSRPGFWSNRITRLLARAHMTGAVLLTTGLVAQHAALRADPQCAPQDSALSCLNTTLRVAAVSPYMILAIAAGVGLLLTAVAVCVLPTMTIEPIETQDSDWPGRLTATLFALSLIALTSLLAMLVFLARPTAFTAPTSGRGLYGAGFVPLVLIGIAAVLAATGVFWRPWRGRRATAWAGCAPAVFMTVSLSLAVATSAIVVVTVGNWLNGSLAAAELIRDHSAKAVPLQIPSVWVGLGASLLAAILVGILLVLTAVLVPRDLAARASAWDAPAQGDDEVIPIEAGVMPVSQQVLLARIQAKRRSAALLHLVEPAFAIVAVLLAAGVTLGLVWTGTAYQGDVSLWAVLPDRVSDAAIKNTLNVAMWGLGASGVLLVGILASGATSSAPRPLGIVWDIACFLPRTGQPFGPPCFAQRAVPEIAGRMFAWLRESDRRRVVLVAHSMGAVLAVSSLGLLASTTETRRMLERVSLLTFGVQLRAYFGRMLPELLGPQPLGTQPSRGPGFYRRDPWSADAAHQRELSVKDPGPTDRLRGTLLAGSAVRWASLWRLTDYLGFPTMSTVRASADGTFRNGVDRFAQELDTTEYMVAIDTHGDYFRAPQYEKTLLELAGLAPKG